MRFAVMGAGAVGSYFGGRLAQAGEDVSFIARGAHGAALREKGLRVKSIDGDFALPSVRATSDPAAVGPVDVVLFSVKAWQTLEAAEAARALVGRETVVISLQNGATIAEEIGRVLGPDRVLGGLCRILAYLSGPGEVTHAAIAPTVVFGERDGSRTPRAEKILDAFSRCQGAKAVLSDDIERDIWTKFLFIAGVSGVGAVTRSPVGVFRTVPECRALLESALREAESLARARGVRLADDVVPRTMAFVDSLPEEGTSSMQRDVIEGRPSELEAQTGAVVRMGREAGVATPVHSFLYAALKPMEMRARGEA